MTHPIHIGTRRELFVDDTLIERMTGARLRLSHPERREVAFASGVPWEDNTLGAYSLVQTESAIRLYYRAAIR